MCGSVGRMWREAHSGEVRGLWVPGPMHIRIVTIEPMGELRDQLCLGCPRVIPGALEWN